MSSARYDLHIEQGATFNLPIIYKVGGVPFDLIGWTPTGQIRKIHKSVTIEATLAFDCPTTGSNLTDGAMTIKLTAVQTGAIACGELETDPRSKYVYDIEITHATQGVKRIMEGFAYISPEVTRT